MKDKTEVVIVTGSSGMIGSALIHKLAEKYHVVGFDHDGIERGKRVADQFDTGMVYINHNTWTQTDLPFGGTKRSGFSRELSELGIQEFVNKKLIRVSALNDPF